MLTRTFNKENELVSPTMLLSLIHVSTYLRTLIIREGAPRLISCNNTCLFVNQIRLARLIGKSIN